MAGTVLVSCNRHVTQKSSTGDYALDFFKEVRAQGKDKGFVVSPYSLASAMMLCAGGAEGNTASEIYDVFGVGVLPLTQTGDSVIVKTANSVWCNQDFPLKQSYLDWASEQYGAEARNVDFGSGHAAELINYWIEDHTNGLIKNVMSEPLRDVHAALVNALYFKGSWSDSFWPDREAKPFYGSTESEAFYMSRTAHFPYLKTDNYQAVRVDYGFGYYSFYVILPEKGKFEKALDSLTDLKALQEAMKDESKEKRVYLTIPKFECEFSLPCIPVLQNLGIKTAFEASKADFSKMSEVPLYISDVLQKAKITVDENGTEAAATTIIKVGRTSVRPVEEPVRFLADHSFIYMICDNRTGQVLFIGQKV